MSALQEFLEQAAIVEMDTAHKGAVAFGRPFIARMASEIRDMAASGSAIRSALAAAEHRATESAARAEQLATALKTYGYRRHYTCEDAFYSCPKSGERYDTVEGVEQECTCGADQHNAKVDAILAAIHPDERRAAEQAVIAAVREEIHATIWTGEGIIGVEASEGMPKTEAALLALDALDMKEGK